MKSTRISTSSSVMALYMAARTPPTNLRTTTTERVVSGVNVTRRGHLPVSLELQKPRTLSLRQELFVGVGTRAQPERHGYAASRSHGHRTRIVAPRSLDRLVQQRALGLRVRFHGDHSALVLHPLQHERENVHSTRVSVHTRTYIFIQIRIRPGNKSTHMNVGGVLSNEFSCANIV